MKKTHYISMLLVAALVLCSGISNAFAQPSCCDIQKCGQWPNCYDPPKVPCNAGQVNNVITNYCAPALNQGLCNPGIFICISSEIPEGYNCNCNGANNCKYISIRNLYECTPNQQDGGNITKIELKLNKDSSSTKWTICSPQTQWGQSPTTANWRIFIGGTSTQVNSGQCNQNNAWGIDIQKYLEIKRPLDQLNQEDAAYDVSHLKHWTAVVCGAESIEIKVTNNVLGASNWFTNIPINTTNCPDASNAYGWCFTDPDECIN